MLARRPVLLQELPHRCPRWIGVVEPRASRRVKQAVSPIARAIHLCPQIRSERIFDQFVMTSITGIVAPPGTPPVTGCHVQQSEGETELSH